MYFGKVAEVKKRFGSTGQLVCCYVKCNLQHICVFYTTLCTN